MEKLHVGTRNVETDGNNLTSGSELEEFRDFALHNIVDEFRLNGHASGGGIGLVVRQIDDVGFSDFVEFDGALTLGAEV